MRGGHGQKQNTLVGGAFDHVSRAPQFVSQLYTKIAVLFFVVAIQT